MSTEWDWFKAALAAKREGKPLPPVHSGQPQSGVFWQKASKQGGRIPVLIRLDANGEYAMTVGTRLEHYVLSADKCSERWSWVADNVTTRDEYRAAWNTGVWPDGTPTVAPELPAGSNLPTDPFERLQAEIDDKMASAMAWLKETPKVENQTVCDRGANLNKELLNLVREADKLHKAEKQPHLDAGRAVDEKYRFREKVESLARQLKNIFEPFMIAEEDRKKKAAQAAFEAERKRVEDERRKIEAEREKLRRDDPIAALTSEEPEMPSLPLAPAPVKQQAGGGVGSARGLKTAYEPEIVDYKATLAHYAGHREVVSVIEKLVAAETRLHKNATKIPGVTVHERRKVA